jgi:predicted MPP superfamily phosphohydrolase
MERLRVTPSQIKRLILKEKPDYIFITGDFLDRPTSFDKLEGYLSVLVASDIPVYAVLGNHDYYLEKPIQLVKLLEKYHIHVLLNESVDLGDFTLIGIDDFCSEKHKINKAFSRVSQVKPKVIITHDPNIGDVLKKDFDYLMSGHLHGKQFNVPYLFRIKDMGDMPRRGIYKGLHQFKHGPIYISKGMGQSGYNFRLFVRSEITIHEL